MITGTVGGTTLRAEELEAAEAWCTGMVNRAACLMVMLHATGTTHENMYGWHCVVDGCEYGCEAFGFG